MQYWDSLTPVQICFFFLVLVFLTAENTSNMYTEKHSPPAPFQLALLRICATDST